MVASRPRASCRSEGRVRFLGFSTHATTDIILEAIQSGEFDYVNLHWYFVNDLNWPAVEAAAARDMGVFIISPNDKGGKLYEPPQKAGRALRASDADAVQRSVLPRPAAGPHAELRRGAPTDFDEHVAALEYYDRIPETIAPIEKRLAQEMQHVLGRGLVRSAGSRACRNTWTFPGEVNVLEILRLWTYAKSLDLVDWGKMRYNLLGQADHWFPEKMPPRRANWRRTDAWTKAPLRAEFQRSSKKRTNCSSKSPRSG